MDSITSLLDFTLRISNSMIFASILASGIPLFKMNSNLFSKGFINYPENNNLVIKNSNHETWYFESFDEKKMRGENIQIYVDNDKGDSAYRLRCRSATWSPITIGHSTMACSYLF